MAELLREPSVTSAISVTTTDTPTPHSIRVVPSDVDATANAEASPSASISHTRSPSNAPSPRHARGCFGRLCSLCASLRRSIREELDSLGLEGSTVIIFVSVIVLCCVCPFVVMLAIGRPTLPFSSGFGVLLFLPAVPIVLSYALLHVTPRIREFDISMTALAPLPLAATFCVFLCFSITHPKACLMSPTGGGRSIQPRLLLHVKMPGSREQFNGHLTFRARDAPDFSAAASSAERSQ